MNNDKSALFESHYFDFKCIGAACEDSCCCGWTVDIDRETYHSYKKNQHPKLKELFSTSIKRRKDDKSSAERFAIISLTPMGNCAFLEKGLCKIQKELGHEHLSNTCKNYPRKKNSFGEQTEYSLSLSCPEAARLTLLHQKQISFIEEQSKTEYKQDKKPSTIDQERFGILNEIRAIIIFTLQHQEISINTRLLFVGILIETIEKHAYPFNSQSIEKLPIITAEFSRLLSKGKEFEKEITDAPSKNYQNLRVSAEIIGIIPEGTNRRFLDCLNQAAQGLEIYEKTTQESETEIKETKKKLSAFFQDNSHIFENYLVHTVFHNLFPFSNEPLIQQYKKLVAHFLVIKTCLFGLTAFHKKINQDITIMAIQGYSKLSDHNANYPIKVISILEKNGISNFRDIFPLIID